MRNGRDEGENSCVCWTVSGYKYHVQGIESKQPLASLQAEPRRRSSPRRGLLPGNGSLERGSRLVNAPGLLVGEHVGDLLLEQNVVKVR